MNKSSLIGISNSEAFYFSAALDAEANKLDEATGGGFASASASALGDVTSTMNENNDDDDDDDDEQEGGGEDEEEVQIDEDLFADDLDDVEEQLRESNLTS